MYFIVYVSSMVTLMSDGALEQLLIKSRANNSQQGITGILLYSEGNIIQVLEGEKKLVLQAYQRIEQDTRHRGIIKLAEGERAERLFKDWSMGFKIMPDTDFSQLLGYINPTQASFSNAEFLHSEDLRTILLASFIKNTIPIYK